MSTTDWIGYFIAVAIVFLLGWWLHRVNRKSPDARIESLAIALGWSVFAFIVAGNWSGVA